ncbi:MAG: shikimate kinase [Gammaproteobacteria bacterium]
MLIILFGLAGAGKSYAGEILANHFNYYFWDADGALPEKMRESVHNKQAFTQEMRDEFISLMIDKIKDLCETHQNLVVSQALYKETNRNEIKKYFPDALFIHVKSDPAIVLQRLKDRNDWVDPTYADQIAANFEEPQLPHKILINNQDEKAVIEQLKLIPNVVTK